MFPSRRSAAFWTRFAILRLTSFHKRFPLTNSKAMLLPVNISAFWLIRKAPDPRHSSPDRTQSHLADYWRNIPRKERLKVKFFVCDMWRPYTELAQTFFPNATIIVDKYHFIRQVTWAIENVRKRYRSAPCRFLCVSIINAPETHSDPLQKAEG